jgi:mannosyltransferase OCH1-like enzyme
MIPHIIHQIWDERSRELPPFLAELGETWKKCHPSWQYEYWDYKRMENFITSQYPEWNEMYHGLTYDAQRWDIIRYLILYKMGGLYVDFDYECFEAVDKYLEEKSCCFGMEHEEHARLYNKKYPIISNAFIASIPKHPFIMHLLETVKKVKSSAIDKPTYVLETTGPHMISETYRKYSQKHKVNILPAELIAPLSRNEVTGYIRGSIDTNIIEKKIEKSIAIHYFLGTWI